MDLFIKRLSHSKEKQKVIGIRLYGSEDDYSCGYVVDHNEEILAFQRISVFGHADGIMVYPIWRIEAIDIDDDYCEGIAYLAKGIYGSLPRNEKQIKLVSEEEWAYNILRHMEGKEEAVKLELADFNTIGLIKAIDEDYVDLAELQKDGKAEGRSCYRLSDVKSLLFASQQINRRLALLQWKSVKGVRDI